MPVYPGALRVADDTGVIQGWFLKSATTAVEKVLAPTA